jgi:hypothetical protein
MSLDESKQSHFSLPSAQPHSSKQALKAAAAVSFLPSSNATAIMLVLANRF